MHTHHPKNPLVPPRAPSCRTPKQVKNKFFYEKRTLRYFYFKKKCDICTYKSKWVDLLIRKSLQNRLVLVKKCTGGYLFSIISVNTGNLKIIQKNYEYND